jgi:hypothetical protein
MEKIRRTISARRIWMAAIILSLMLPALLNRQGNVAAAPGVPNIISYQGRLTNASGQLLGGSGTDYCFQFSIYDNSVVGAGTRVWPSVAPGIVSATVTQGVFNVNIGDTSNGYPDALDYDFQSNDTVFLNVQVAEMAGGACGGGDETFENLSPRQQITSSGFAINAGSVLGRVPGVGADNILLLDGSGNVDIAGNIITANNLQGAAVLTNTITPSNAMTIGSTSHAALLQGSVVTITSTGAGNNIVLTSGNLIQLQSSTDITGNLDITGVIQAGTSDVNITLAT